MITEIQSCCRVQVTRLPDFALGTDTLLRTFPGAGISLGSLATGRQAASMPQTAVAANIHETLYAHVYFTSKVTFDNHLPLQYFTEPGDFVVGEIPNASLFANSGALQELLTGRVAHAINVGQADQDPFVPWKVYACDSCHRARLSSPVAAYASDLNRSPARHLCA
jgi:hypothetical protein